MNRTCFRIKREPKHSRARSRLPFFATRICLALAVVMLLVFSSLEDFAAVGRGPLLALLFVALARALLIARRIDTWLSGALVIACITALVFLSELSRIDLIPVMIIASAAAAAVVVALTFAEAEAFAKGVPGSSGQSIVLDLRSLARVSARLVPMVLAIALLLPEMAQLGHRWFPELEASRAASNSGSAGIGNTGFSPNMEPGLISKLEPDPTPILVLKRMTATPPSQQWFANTNHANGVIYLRSYSLSEGFGFKWSMDRRDYVLSSPDKVPERLRHDHDEILARVLFMRTEEAFLFHPYGTTVKSAAEASSTPDGGAMLLSRPQKSWRTQSIVYNLVRSPHSRHTAAKTPPAEMAPSSLSSMARTPEAFRLFRSLTGKDVSKEALEPREALALVRQLFSGGGYSYTLEPDPITTPDPLLALSSFLRVTRQGYCEHFATAAASLMQIAGVPTRLVAGLMGRDSVKEKTLVFTRADAHAWFEYQDTRLGRWIVVDPTAWITSLTDLPRQSSTDGGIASLGHELRGALDSALMRAALWIRESLESVIQGTRWEGQAQVLDIATNSITLKLTLVGTGLIFFFLLRLAIRSLHRASVETSGRGNSYPSGLKRLALRLGINFRHKSEDAAWNLIERDDIVRQICHSIARKTGAPRAATESMREYLNRLVAEGKARAAATADLATYLDRELYGPGPSQSSTGPSGKAKQQDINQRIQWALQQETADVGGDNGTRPGVSDSAL